MIIQILSKSGVTEKIIQLDGKMFFIELNDKKEPVISIAGGGIEHPITGTLVIRTNDGNPIERLSAADIVNGLRDTFNRNVFAVNCFNPVGGYPDVIDGTKTPIVIADKDRKLTDPFEADALRKQLNPVILGLKEGGVFDVIYGDLPNSRDIYRAEYEYLENHTFWVLRQDVASENYVGNYIGLNFLNDDHFYKNNKDHFSTNPEMISEDIIKGVIHFSKEVYNKG